MTDPHHPPHDSDPLDPLDALASAHLDGLTTRDDATRAARDPEVAARVDRLAAVRDALRATADDPVPAEARDAAIAAALDAFTETTTGPVAPAVPLVGARRSRPRPRPLQLVGIAAAALLLALTVPLLQRLGSDIRDDTASSSFEATGSSLGPAPEAGATGGSAADSAGGAGTVDAFDAAASPDLGTFADLGALQTAVRGELARPAASTTTQAPAKSTLRAEGSPTCSPAAGPGETVVYRARATVAGQPVTVVVRQRADGGRRLVVLDAACATLSEARL
jgi:hypothetical protein